MMLDREIREQLGRIERGDLLELEAAIWPAGDENALTERWDGEREPYP